MRGWRARDSPPLHRDDAIPACTGRRPGGRSFFALRRGRARADADHADARRRGDRGAAGQRRQPRRGAPAAQAARRAARRSAPRAWRSRGAISTRRTSRAIRALPAWRWRRSRAWPDAATVPDEVLLMRATLEQYLHEFDASVAHLRLAARAAGRRAQRAGLADAGDGAARAGPLRRFRRGLSTRSRGPAPSCTRTPAWPRTPALRGDVAGARAQLRDDARRPGLPAGTRGWLTTSLAELEERDGRAAAADAAYRSVLALGPDSLCGDRLCRLPDRAAAARPKRSRC